MPPSQFLDSLRTLALLNERLPSFAPHDILLRLRARLALLHRLDLLQIRPRSVVRRGHLNLTFLKRSNGSATVYTK